MREFPGLVNLQDKYPDLVCISVNTDYYGDSSEPPESFRPQVIEFLTEQKASFDHFICTDESDAVMAQVDAFSVPVVLVYGPEGRLRRQFKNDDQTYGEEGFTYVKHVEPFVGELADEER